MSWTKEGAIEELKRQLANCKTESRRKKIILRLAKYGVTV